MARRRGNRRRYRRRRLRRYHRRQLRKQAEQRSLIAEAGIDPMWATCPNCDEEIFTTTQKSTSVFQCLAVGGMCLFGLFCPCLFCCFYIPLCMNDWKDVLHTCPNCNYAIGKYKKL